MPTRPPLNRIPGNVHLLLVLQRQRLLVVPLLLVLPALLAVLEQVSSSTSVPMLASAFTLAATKRPFLLFKSKKQNRCALFGISEWRDTDFEIAGSSATMSELGKDIATPKQVCVLPFPYTDVLLQGETKQLRLYEDRFIQLFDYAMDQCKGVVAMGLLAEAGIIQTVPLCEIEAYNRIEGFGIFVTIRAVARAQLLQVTQQEPYIQAVCIEVTDRIPPNLELPNLLASNIENFMLTLSSMEFQLSQAHENDKDSMDEQDLELERRINIARLDDTFYAGDDDEEEDDRLPDRRGRFQMAYHTALETDSQGYTVPTRDVDRSAKELTAISWAAFCTELLAEDDATFRIQALDADDLFERLKLGSYLLRQKKETLRERLKKAGIKYYGEESDENEDRL